MRQEDLEEILAEMERQKGKKGKGRKKKKKNGFSKKVVVGVIVLNVLFAAAVLLAFWHTGNEPGALVVAWFAFTTGELWTLGKIRREKKKEEENE